MLNSALSRAFRAVMVGHLIALGACTDYLDRRETVSYSAGNAVAYNQAVHMIDPWPAHAKNTRIDTSGERMARAVRRYETCYTKESEVTTGGSSSIETEVACAENQSGSASAQ
jgi:hypothetical protein